MQNQFMSEPKTVAGYALQERLGSGSFATVYKGVKIAATANGDQSTDDSGMNAPFTAVKVISRISSKLTPKALSNLEMEIAIMQKYSHPNLITLLSVTKTDNHFYLFLDYCGGGDVQKLIRTRNAGRITERFARRLMRDLASGLKFLCQHQLIHRDIKPQNLLLTGHIPLDETSIEDQHKIPHEEQKRKQANFPSHKFRLKIADFGFARHLQTTCLAETLCGSPLYMAPEILQHKRYDSKADLWSAGTVLFEMITGRPPFHGENHIDLLRNIQQKAVRLPPNVKISKECINLLRILLNRNPSGRATFEEFFNACNDFIALGCNGEPIEPNNAAPSTSLQPTPSSGLNPIVEEGETNTQSSSIAYPTNQNNCDLKMPIHMRAVTPPFTSRQSPTAPPPMTHNETSIPQQQQQHQHQSTVSRIYSKFSPLEASPPGPRYLSGAVPVPPPMLLGGSNNTHNLMPPQNRQQLSHNNQSIRSHDALDDGEFVLVDRNVVNSTTIGFGSQNTYGPLNGYEQSSKLSPLSMLSRMTGVNLSGNSQMQTQNPHNIPSAPLLIPNSKYNKNKASRGSMVPGFSKGMLSTSPGTGQALINMMGAAAAVASKGVSAAGFSSTSNTTYTQHPPVATVNIDTLTRIVSAAEDVGRRAMNVALLGDSRVFTAMRLMHNTRGENSVDTHENKSNTVPMEEDSCSDNTPDTDDASMTSCTYPFGKSNHMRRDSSSTQRSSITRTFEDDEMPFAMPSTENDHDIQTQQPTGAETPKEETDINRGSDDKEQITDEVNRQMKICVHFREALSCYLKSLSMLKGGVDATQQALKELESLDTIKSSVNSNFKNRCDVSHSWLSKQFSTVLERADAANLEIEKILSKPASETNSTRPFHTYVSSLSNDQRYKCLPVEELIYNHSLSVGRDGAVKQLLGQYETARSCYRSAGLLAETLLMEPRLGDDDRNVLESYVQGFSDRINELDSIMLQQQRNQQSEATISSNDGGSATSPPIPVRKGSSVIGLVGGLVQNDNSS